MTRNAAKHEALLDELLKDYTDPKDILGEHGLLRRLTKRVIERMKKSHTVSLTLPTFPVLMIYGLWLRVSSERIGQRTDSF